MSPYKVIERYENKKGETVLEIKSNGSGYRYCGKGSMGAGCGQDLDVIKDLIFGCMSPRKKANVIKVS